MCTLGLCDLLCTDWMFIWYFVIKYVVYPQQSLFHWAIVMVFFKTAWNYFKLRTFKIQAFFKLSDQAFLSQLQSLCRQTFFFFLVKYFTADLPLSINNGIQKLFHIVLLIRLNQHYGTIYFCFFLFISFYLFIYLSLPQPA